MQIKPNGKLTVLWQNKQALWRAAKVPLLAGGLGAATYLGYQNIPSLHHTIDSIRELAGHHPQLYESLTSAISLGLIPDLTAQKYEGKKINYFRVFYMSLIGGISGGILIHKFYQFQMATFPGNDFVTTVKKIAVDQLAFAPAYLSLYFPLTKILHDQRFTKFFTLQTWKDLARHTGAQLRAILPTNWFYWCLIALPIIYNVPLDLQVYLQNFFALFWFSYLSQRAHQAFT